MGKIVAFVGSPRENSFSTRLLRQVLAGAKAADAEIVVYHLNDGEVKGCQGCFYCRSHEGCATQDKLQPMYQDVKAADGIVASFPIYFGDICGQAKLWLDRMYPMIDRTFAPRFPSKRAITIFSQGNPDANLFRACVDKTNAAFVDLFGWELLQTFLICGTGDPQFEISEELMDKAFAAGKALVQ